MPSGRHADPVRAQRDLLGARPPEAVKAIGTTGLNAATAAGE